MALWRTLSAHNQLLQSLIPFATVGSKKSGARQMKGDVSSHNMWVSRGNLCHMAQYKLNSHTSLGGPHSVRKAVKWSCYQDTTAFQEFPEPFPEEERGDLLFHKVQLIAIAWDTALVWSFVHMAKPDGIWLTLTSSSNLFIYWSVWLILLVGPSSITSYYMGASRLCHACSILQILESQCVACFQVLWSSFQNVTVFDILFQSFTS